jgi:hypothetical protein
MRKRDNFCLKTKETLARRVGMHCSNPNCAKLTSGPQKDIQKVLNIGVAAHITAASLGGVRYDPTLTKAQRKSGENGVWLCQSCAKLVDNDANRYSVDLLRKWKLLAEESARLRVEGAGSRDRKEKKYYIVTFDDHKRLEDIVCPTCGETVKLDLSMLAGASGVAVCTKCGHFHAHRDRDGSIITRPWAGGLKPIYVACPKCSNRLRVRADRKKFIKPCLDCESVLNIHSGNVTSIAPMNPIPAKAFTKEGWQQLLTCPHCNVRGMTLGANSKNILFAQCPKCLYYLTFPKPLDQVSSKQS